MNRYAVPVLLIALAASAGIARAEKFSAPDYDSHVTPILKKFCVGCHNGREAKGDLDLQRLAGLKKGGKRGPALIAGKSGESLLIATLRGEKKPSMPPKGKPRPSDAEIELLAAWIDAGALGSDKPRPKPLVTPKIEPVGSVTEGVNSLRFSPDGKIVAIAQADAVLLVDASGGVIRNRLVPHNGAVTSVRFSRDGYDFVTFREGIRDELMISEVRRRQVESRVQISERDIDHYLSTAENREAADRRQYRIGHILIAVPADASPEETTEARSRAERVLAEIRTGADFANMAVAHSDGQQALDGGDLGWRKAADLPTLFSDAVLRLKAGEVTEPIRSPSGFHLVKLIKVEHGGERQIIEQTRARHILMVLDELTDEAAAIRQLRTLRERIVNGEDFGELARVHSDDSGSAPRGGDLGWIDPGNTVPEFERMMDSLAPGGISEPFRSQFGWHVVQVLERREHDDTGAARRSEAVRRLRARRVEEEMQTWLRQLRDEAYVEYRLDE